MVTTTVSYRPTAASTSPSSVDIEEDWVSPVPSPVTHSGESAATPPASRPSRNAGRSAALTVMTIVPGSPATWLKSTLRMSRASTSQCRPPTGVPA